MGKVSGFGKKVTRKLVFCFLIGSLALTGTASTKFDSPIETINSSSIVYTSSSGMEALSSDIVESELPKSLAQVAFSPLLEASKKIFHHLPLESLFPQISSTTNITGNAPEHRDLTSALLNHSLHHDGTDDELDRIVFSNLPEGSKLVLKTVKMMKTDENGNEEPMGDAAISWDVLPIGSSRLDSEEGEDESDEHQSAGDKDLASDASSHKAGYNSYGRNDKEKERKENHHHGQNYGKDQRETLGDSKGKKLINYKGREKGLTDFDHAHGNSQSNDGERFKNSKKKNKGRKVTGFKRVYHKEEFQRTEHFYDDEEAKKIAESYGLGDSKYKQEEGKKGDDRKYHGDRLEHSDGKKVKNEHSTNHGHHKGHHTAHENTDKHKQGQQYSRHQHGHPSYNHQHHPNHRYNGAYSHTQPHYDPGLASTQETAVASHRSPTPLGPKLKLNPSDTSPRIEKLPRQPKMPSTRYLDEAKNFRTQTNRFSPQQLSHYYAPNFGPISTTDRANPVNYFSHDYNDGYGNWENGTRSMSPLAPRTRSKGGSRYAGRYPRPLTFDSSPQYNSQKLNDPAPTAPYYPATGGQNLISIEKAVVTKVGPPYSYYQGPGTRGIFSSNGYTDWNPVPSGSMLNGHNFNTTFVGGANQTLKLPSIPPNRPVSASKDKNKAVVIHTTLPSPNPSFGWETSDHFPPPSPPFRMRDPRLLPDRPVPYARLKSNGEATGFYSGHTLSPQQQHSEEYKSPSASPNYSRKVPPSFSNFMNGLMNSVSEFFTRMG